MRESYSWCAVCKREANKRYREKNREKLRAADRASYAANRADRLAASNAQYWANREDRLAKAAALRARPGEVERHKAYDRAYYQRNKESMKARSRAWQQGNRERRNATTRARLLVRRATDVMHVLTCRVRCAVWRVARGQKAGRSWTELVGYSPAALLARLNDTMPEGYTWQDFLDGALHIDHIIPIASFDYTAPEDPAFTRCWALSNLQLLPASENLSKGARLDHPSQVAALA